MYLSKFGTRVLIIIAIAGLLVAILVPAAPRASAATNIEPEAKVTFTFDDGYASTYTQAAPILDAYGLAATAYVVSDCIGMTTAPNTCHADVDGEYMTWEQVTGLQNTYDWEIGSQTATHPYLASSNADDGQPNILTPAQVEQELVQSKAALEAHGLNIANFSTPYGDYNNAVLAQIGKYYNSHRGFADVGDNVWPYSDLLLNNFPVQTGVSVSEVQAKIDAAIANDTWLILTLHDVQPNPSSDPEDYEYGSGQLDQIAQYVKQQQDAGLLETIKINEGLVESSTNLLPNSSFTSGIAEGWTTDSPTIITADATGNGGYPGPAHSVKFTSGSANAHLFSPKVEIDPEMTYLLKNYINVASISSGELAFYIDEYDAAGNWISGQYKTAEPDEFVEYMNFVYTPSTMTVSQASLQVISTGGSNLTAYFDNPEWFALEATPNPGPTNLVANGTFDSGIAEGWTTDSAPNITADSGNNGSPNNPTNSISLTAATANEHLFSPRVPVSSSEVYSLTSYLDIAARDNNEVGFYIDEYDALGNWVSGQYKLGVTELNTGDISFNYTPSSANVATASLQVITTGNSGIHAYYDDVRWYKN